MFTVLGCHVSENMERVNKYIPAPTKKKLVVCFSTSKVFLSVLPSSVFTGKDGFTINNSYAKRIGANINVVGLARQPRMKGMRANCFVIPSFLM